MTLRDRDDWQSAWLELGASATRNPARAYRSRLIRDAVAEAGEAPRIIDFGSGQGDLALEMQRAFPGAVIAGFELSESGVEIARRKLPAGRFIQADLLKDERPAAADALRGWADVAICSEVLEHVDQPEIVLRNIRPYLRPGGRLIVTVPAGPMSAFDRHIGHRRHYPARALSPLLDGAGYRIVRLASAGFPFFNLYRLTVILRGEAVIRDAVRENGRTHPALLAAFAAYDALFRWNLANTPWGWQSFAVARPSAE